MVEWKRISYYLSEIEDKYLINNYGIIYSEYKDKALIPQFYSNGYTFVRLKLKDGTQSAYMIHRLVMICFNYIENHDDYQVNHKNGNKSTNGLWNLEWSSRSENMIHAYDNGLAKRGEEHWNSVFKNEDVENICKLLSEGKLQYGEILTKLGFEDNINNRNIIKNIRNNNCYTFISEKYNFPDKKFNNQTFSTEQVHLICQMIKEGKSYDDILYSLNINDDILKNKYKVTLYKIKKGLRYRDISKQYFEK